MTQTTHENAQRRAESTPAAAEFDRPLLLTPAQDIIGYAGSIAGRVTLFVIAASSVLAVLLIIGFILAKAAPFLRGDQGLIAEGQGVATVPEGPFDDVEVRARMYLGDGDVRIGARVDGQSGYFLDYRAGAVELLRIGRDGQKTVLAEMSDPNAMALKPDRWHPVEIILDGGRVEARVDEGSGQVALRYEDPEPLAAGTVAFRSTKRTKVALDKITVIPQKDAPRAEGAPGEPQPELTEEVYRYEFEPEGDSGALTLQGAWDVDRHTGGLGEFLLKTAWHPTDDRRPDFGGIPLIAGTLYVTVGALAIAVPVGLLCAVLLSDILPFGARQVIKPIIEILASIPSVALGFFALLVVAPWLQEKFGLDTGTNVLNASLMLSVMAIPTIVSIADDALTASGRDLREGSYALGATRAETLIRVVIPAAHNGIIAAVILGMMRAVGETMLVWMAAGNAAQIPAPWWDVTESVRTMTATIAGEMGETPKNTLHYHSLFAIGVVLLGFTLVLNLVCEWLMARVRRSEGAS